MEDKGTRLRPPVSYYGGKQRMAANIIPLIPRHIVYVEPFCGGAAIMFMKPQPDIADSNKYTEAINDIDGRLVNFYRQLRDNGEELVRVLQLTPYSEEEHRLSKGLDCEDKLEAARRYFINIQQSFAHTLGRGWGRSVFGNCAAIFANKVARMPQYLERMRKINIANTEAIKFIEQYDSPHTFFYCDPPYPNTDQGNYKGYSVEDFKRLIETLKNCQGSFIVSNYDQPNVKIPSDWERHEFSVYCSAQGRVGNDRSKMNADDTEDRQRTEVVWRRMNTVAVREDIQKLYNTGAYNCFTGDGYKPAEKGPTWEQESLI